jgi:S-adenosylmethionine-diacylgycerolhomoserine-N-methlytransferase
MGAVPARAADHAALMDATYRHQRWIYDASRRWFLFGRDHLIAQLDPPTGGRVLEVACGTGRNLAAIGRRHPGCRLYGLDISSQMLRTARAKLPTGVALAEADATDFDGAALFGTGHFNRVVLSYSLSMIPDWTAALETALRHTMPGGSVHVVDFGDFAGWPGWFGRGLRAWLRRFHVEPRAGLRDAMARLATETGATATWTPLYGGYAQYGVLARSVAT